jgi:hypothetical protein
VVHGHGAWCMHTYAWWMVPRAAMRGASSEWTTDDFCSLCPFPSYLCTPVSRGVGAVAVAPKDTKTFRIQRYETFWIQRYENLWMPKDTKTFRIQNNIHIIISSLLYLHHHTFRTPPPPPPAAANTKYRWFQFNATNTSSSEGEEQGGGILSTVLWPYIKY